MFSAPWLFCACRYQAFLSHLAPCHVTTWLAFPTTSKPGGQKKRKKKKTRQGPGLEKFAEDILCVKPRPEEQDEEVCDEQGPVQDLEVPSVQMRCELGILEAQLWIDLVARHGGGFLCALDMNKQRESRTFI